VVDWLRRLIHGSYGMRPRTVNSIRESRRSAHAASNSYLSTKYLRIPASILKFHIPSKLSSPALERASHCRDSSPLSVTMPSPVVVSLAGVVVTYVFLRTLVYFTQDPREPPVVVGTIPFISPLVGMMTEKAKYFIRLR
jgi:hypothetical protein